MGIDLYTVMPRFSVNISMMFTELPFLDRFAAAAAAGFTGVDIQFPYEFPVARIAQEARDADVSIVLINAPAGDRSRNEPGIACQPERREEFREGIDIACEYAQILQCSRVNILAGRVGSHPEVNHATLIDNLAHGSDMLARINVQALVEPINGIDVPGYFIQTTADAVACINEVRRENLKLQFDIYHRHVSEGNVLDALTEFAPLIGHIQFADAPGRRQPGTGVINYSDIFKKIDKVGYSGWVGAEYIPTHSTADSLVWYRDWS